MYVKEGNMLRGRMNSLRLQVKANFVTIGLHGSLEARTGLRDSHRGKSRTGHYPMMVGDSKIVYGTPVD